MADELIGDAAAGPGRRSHHSRRQPAARARNRGRSRPAGHRPGRHPPRSSASSPIRAWKKCWAAAKTRPAPKWAARACRWTSARCRPPASAPPCSTSPAARTTMWPSAPAPCRMGLKLSEYGLFRVGGRCARGRRNRSRRLPGARPALDSARAARKLRRDRSRRRRPPARTGGAGRHPRRSPHAHHRDRRPRHAGGNGRSRAAQRGYEYIAITDHSKALAMANGLDEKRVVAFARQVREINREGRSASASSPGSSATSCKDGAMDLANDALAELDLVIGSVHSHMNLESAEMTDRLLRALECPHLRILGHPTGRILLHRDPFPFDFDRVVAEAVAARRVAGNQRQPRAARPARRADPRRQGQGRALHHFHRRPPSQAPGQHALRRADGAARLARAATTF